MPDFSRHELEEMMQRWVAANDRAGETGDWDPMADFYTEDAVYSWNNGSKYEFVAQNRDEIQKWVFGTEMEGLGKWTYPYVRVLIDESQAEVVGSPEPEAPGSAMRATTSGPGSVISSTTPTQEPSLANS